MCAGYKMCARLYLNGDGMGKGTHVSLFFVVMRGAYDALLKWPFRQKVCDLSDHVLRTLLLATNETRQSHTSELLATNETRQSHTSDSAPVWCCHLVSYFELMPYRYSRRLHHTACYGKM